MNIKRKVAFLTLGCKTNQYETNGMMQKFLQEGYEICDVEDKPDIFVVNTCTVTNIADRKSRQLLRRAKNNPETVVIACGCYVQLAKDKLEQMPEIDLVLGNKEKKDIVKYVEEYLQIRDRFFDVQAHKRTSPKCANRESCRYIKTKRI